MAGFVVQLAKNAAVGDGSPFSSAIPNAGSKSKADSSPASPPPPLRPLAPSPASAAAPAARPATTPVVPPPPPASPPAPPPASPPVSSPVSSPVSPPASLPAARSVGGDLGAAAARSTSLSSLPSASSPFNSGLSSNVATRSVSSPFTRTLVSPTTADGGGNTSAHSTASTYDQQNMRQFFELLAPIVMRQAAPTVGAIGGIPLLMLMWDLIGGSHGENIKTIFGDRIQQAVGGTGSNLGAAAAGQSAALAVPSASAGLGGPGPVSAAPAVSAPAASVPAVSAPAVSAPASGVAGPAVSGAGSSALQSSSSVLPKSVGAELGTAAASSQGTGTPSGAPTSSQVSIPAPFMEAFRRGSGITPGDPNYIHAREALAEHLNLPPEQVPEDRVWDLLYRGFQDEWARANGGDMSHEAFVAQFQGGPSAGMGMSESQDLNAAQRFRQWLKRNTSTGEVDVGGLSLDPGRFITDAVAPQVGAIKATRSLLSMLPQSSSGAIPKKAPGLFLPVVTGLDLLDTFGLNPTTDRFGKGTVTSDEARQVSQQLEGNPALASLMAFSQPIQGTHRTIVATGDAANAVGDAMRSQDATYQAERQRMAQTNQAPSTMPTAPSEYFFTRNPDGSYRKKTLGEALGQVHNKAWEYSYVPGVNYLMALAEANTEGMLQLRDQFHRKKMWREWAKAREQQLREAAQQRDPAQRAWAEAELARLDQERKRMNPGALENLYHNVTQGRMAGLGDILRGNFHMPWSSGEGR